MRRILIVEDDPAIALGLTAALRDAQFEPVVIADGAQGCAAALNDSFDLLVLDLMLPSMPGEEICRTLRAKGRALPIIMLTSKDQEIDKVLGLEMGADDYLTKPFSVRELVARVHALLRRTVMQEAGKSTAAFGDVQVDLRTQSATKAGEPLALTAREFRILKYFIAHQEEVVTRDMLLDEVWGYETFPTTRTVDNYILSLRKKIEDDPAHPVHLITVHTAGYRFMP